jgi:hypothetical protein
MGHNASLEAYSRTDGQKNRVSSGTQNFITTFPTTRTNSASCQEPD